VVPRTLPITSPATCPASPNSPTSAASSGLKQHLYRKSPVPRADYVTASDLAKELDVDVDRIQSLIDRRYLRVMLAAGTLAETVVARPAKAAMDWLRSMFVPLTLRPLIPTQDIVAALAITEDEFRYMCLVDNIPLQEDPVFGELMSVTAFYVLQQSWLKMRNPMRSDRAALMLMLGILKGALPAGRLTPLPFSDRIDKEISRIARMDEPDRSLRATDLWIAYNDADTLTDCLNAYFGDERKRKRRERLEKRVDVIEKRLEGGPKKKLLTAPDSTDDAASGGS
jgi:hypothetical protein